MANESTLSREELDNRIAILRDNTRQLTEQAAAASVRKTCDGRAELRRPRDRVNIVYSAILRGEETPRETTSILCYDRDSLALVCSSNTPTRVILT